MLTLTRLGAADCHAALALEAVKQVTEGNGELLVRVLLRKLVGDAAYVRKFDEHRVCSLSFNGGELVGDGNCGRAECRHLEQDSPSRNELNAR